MSSTLKTDEALVAQAIKELPYVTIAYEQLIHRHYPLIYRTCFGILRNVSDAEDTSQVVLLKIFHGLSRFQSRSSFKTWMLKITTNTCYTLYNKTKLERERFSDLNTENETVDDQSTETPESSWSDNFETMVQYLNDEERQIVTLRFISDLSLAEIAEVMGLKLSATKMRFYRAIEKLKKHSLSIG